MAVSPIRTLPFPANAEPFVLLDNATAAPGEAASRLYTGFAREDVLPDASAWVVGGHSLGGTVASLQADQVAGLLLYASYPASDIHESLTADVLSISGTEDGLATPEKITASAATLPADAEFLVLEGVSHAQFGAYGPQPGDGVPQVSDETARTWISDASVMFVDDAGTD